MPPRHQHQQQQQQPNIASRDAINSINSIRNDLEKMRNDHQQLDKTEARRREQLRQEREDRIHRMRDTAAKEVTNPKSATTKSNLNRQGAMTRGRCFALFLGFVCIVFGIVLNRLGAGTFLITDSVCAIRRTAKLIPNLGSQLDELNIAAHQSYEAEVHSEDHNTTFFWGTYRPNVLAGVKSRETEPLMFGIAWWDGKRMLPVRHTAEDGEAVFFRWDAHDGRWYGREVIEDRELGMKLNVRFAKAPSRAGWVLNIQSQRKAPFQIVFAVYFASEFQGNQMSVKSHSDLVSSIAAKGLNEGAFSTDSKLVLDGHLQTKNKKFVATVSDDLGTSSQESQWQVFGIKPSGRKDEAWNIDFNRALRGGARLAEHNLFGRKKFPKVSSVVFAKRVTNDFRFTVTLNEQESSIDRSLIFQDACTNEAVFQHLEKRFDERFEEIFEMSSHYKNLELSNPKVTESVFRVMTQSGLSNLLGGMGYWHGDFLVQTEPADPRRGKIQPTIETRGPRTLFSGVPSRAKFPRGFLWDEGFHQLLVHHWDRALSEDVLLHWLVGAMEPNGWIPREQILGNEARTRVPAEFVPQHPEHTNPPAMILVIQGMMMDQIRGSSSSAAENSDSSSSSVSLFSQKALPQLQKWFKFLVESQCGGKPSQCSKKVVSEEMSKKSAKELESQNSTFLFRWRSRNGYHLLASGLDDYPRPHCKVNNELHVDLYSWVHMVSRSMKMMKNQLEYDTALGLASPSPSASQKSDEDENENDSSSTTTNLPHLAVSDEAWQKWLVDIHWDEKRQQFSDVTGCASNKADKKHFSQFFGYINLFPVLTLSLDDTHRDQILATIRKAKTELSSGKGLQSLSNRTRKFLDKHDDYWTGPIWININFLFLRAMKRKYIAMIGPEAAAVYDEVRRDVLMNIGRVFADTGKLWENYDFKTGNGRGTAPFTGWTALVILIAAEKY